MKIGFDNEKYLTLQTQRIRERVDSFGGKLYLEFGGKLFDDYHASRVLPGFHPDSKMQMLLKIKDEAEIVIAINAGDIEKNKVRGDLGITYDLDTMRLIDAFREYGFYVGSVVLTQFAGQASAEKFERKLQNLGIKTYRHYTIPEYPTNISLIVSDEGFGRNDYIQTTRPIVVVTAPGPGSGKMATCLSQLYHDHLRGIGAGYAKFETFPIWNIPLKHPVNLAYEAATIDLNDVNMIDPFHLEAYGEKAVNYNRDIEIFPVLEAMFRKIHGKCPYKSPTDMGVNAAGDAIIDDDICCEASKQEIIRRFYNTQCAVRKGNADPSQVQKLEVLMESLDLECSARRTVPAALTAAEVTGGPAAAIELQDGTLITGKTTDLLGAVSAALLNALKHLAKIDDKVELISPAAITPIQNLKTQHFGSRNPRLHTDEVLIALSMSAVDNPVAALALEKLDEIRDCQVHTSVILSSVDENVFKKLGAQLTSEPVYQNSRLYHK
ncbi:MAG: DUF1846 domain-containing protein [Oscillospiraceae bacterium]|nr:DUF1846 domain-containing protein [Oscillospiraceae bacterium]